MGTNERPKALGTQAIMPGGRGGFKVRQAGPWGGSLRGKICTDAAMALRTSARASSGALAKNRPAFTRGED